MATTDTYSVIVNTTQANSSIAKLNAGLDRTGKMFGGLKSTLAGVGFAAFGRSALIAADEMQDLANATGIAVGRIKEFKEALATSGGDANTAANALTTFTRSIDEANQGSLKAQNSMRELEISMFDLKTLSESDILIKALDGIAGITDESRRSAVMMDKFGKAFRTVDPGELADKMRKSAGEGDKYAQSIKRAAELNDAFTQATMNLKIAFLEAFSPAIKMINEFNDKAIKNKSYMDSLIAGFKGLASVMVAVFSSGVLLAFVKTLGTVGRGFGIIAKAAGATGIGAWASKAFAASGKVFVALRAIAVLISAGMGIYAATQLFDNFGDIAVNALARISESLLNMAGDFANIPTDGIAALMNLFGAGIDTSKVVGLGTPFNMAADAIKNMRTEAEKTQAAKKAADATAKALAVPDETEINRTQDFTAYDKAINAAKNLGDQYRINNENVKNQIQLETVLIGKSALEKDLISAKADLYQRERDEVEKLTQAMENLSKEEKDAGVTAEYERQIELVKQHTFEEEKTLDMLIKRREEEQRIFDIKQFGLQQEIAGQEKLRAMQSDTAQLTMTTLAKKYKEIEDSAEATYQSKLAEARLANQDLSADDIANIRKAAYSNVDAMKASTQANYDASRSFSTGWSQAFNEYVENATNAANQAKEIFTTVTKGMEDLIIGFAKTGKFEFKSFINDVVEMLLRSEIQRTMANIFTSNTNGQGATGLMSGIGSLLGFANGTSSIPTNGPVLVGERGPEILTGVGGRGVIPNDQLGGGSTQVTYNINAVDARSFQQLLAQDPEFLYAVSLKGQRSMPGGIR